MTSAIQESVLASRKASGHGDAMRKSLAILDQTLSSYDVQLARIQKAPYVIAADKSLNTAFVPYDNASAVHVGDKVYACALGAFWCKPVGTVAEILDGEVTGKHPLHNRELRGVLARLRITDGGRSMQQPVLYLHRAPLGL